MHVEGTLPKALPACCAKAMIVNVENWLLNESVWLGRSVYDVTVVVSFAEGPFH